MNPKITALQKRRTTVVIEDPVIGSIEFVVRPIPAYDLLSNIDKFSAISNSSNVSDPDNVSAEDAKKLKEQIVPLMNVIIPGCVIDPPISIDDNDPRFSNGEAMHIRDLDYKTLMTLFNKITSISGLDKASEDERKNLAGQTSVKV